MAFFAFLSISLSCNRRFRCFQVPIVSVAAIHFNVAENEFATVTAVQDVVNRTGLLNAKLAGHAGQIPTPMCP
jgi:hypothetical protein